MKHLSVLIKPASSLCNMRCRYCFYADVSDMRETHSFGIMQMDTANVLIKNVFLDLDDGDGITFLFQGGEPTLTGLPFFESFVRTIRQQKRKVTVHYALQTNGLLLDDPWCRFLKEYGFLVGLSLDGHDANRVDVKGQGTYRQVLRAKELLEAYQVDYNVLCVLTNALARHPFMIWRFLLEQKVRFVQFIPCLGSLDGNGREPYALTPERFASFYGSLFPVWLQELNNGNYVSIKLFDDVINLLSKGIVSACGLTGQCQPQYVIEADGGVYPCDFYVLDRYHLGNIRENTLRE